jgi:hypothetical protein
MPRFEVAAAYVLGVLLPVLETLRRRTNFENFESYADDFIAGGLLLFAAISVSRRRVHGGALLAGAWGVVCGGFYGSFFGQLRSTAPSDVSGLPNAAVVVIKAAIFAVGIVAFVLSVVKASSKPRE